MPWWVILSCQTAMGVGTLFGGWRIVKTMGQKITKLKPVGGFCAESGGALTLFFALIAAARPTGGEGFYAYMAHNMMIAIFIPAFVAPLALIGLSGAGYVLLMAHGRSFLPDHLVGRGVTFLNMISIGGVGVDRLAMLKYGMDDLRPFFESDVRWLKHYGFSALDVPTLSGGVGA